MDALKLMFVYEKCTNFVSQTPIHLEWLPTFQSAPPPLLAAQSTGPKIISNVSTEAMTQAVTQARATRSVNTKNRLALASGWLAGSAAVLLVSVCCRAMRAMEL